MPKIGSSGFLGRVNTEEDIFKKRLKTEDNSVTPAETKSASKAKIATPVKKGVTTKTNGTNATDMVKSLATGSAETTSTTNAANEAYKEAIRKSGLGK